MLAFDRLCIAGTLLLYVAGTACIAEQIFGRNQLLVGIGVLIGAVVGIFGTRAIANEAIRRQSEE